ncbi:SCO0930 family lipoprotein [Streptomyces sp. ODS28]|uniref:SCO0930 family lipoprotein n=1 Tax=Streptomyces sp. ODS28 TaxID=3136688 RepID=UPI0031EEE960
MNVPHRPLPLAAAAACVLLATACGYGGGSGQHDQSVRPAGDASNADNGYGTGYGTGSTPQKTAAILTTRTDPRLGKLVTDDDGRTLYRFDKDTAHPPASHCAGSCASAWPPVPAKNAEPAHGIAPEALGKVRRKDGSWQLTLGGWPVYRYAEDTAPGDTKGEGVGGTWHALSPTGAKAKAGAPAKPTAQLSAVDNPALGRILADAEGRTLYRFDKDSAWPMRSRCTDACLNTWKPAAPVDESKLSGVTRKAVGTYRRADGTRQLTIDCWPVYWFTGDTRPGETRGQNKMGLWHAVTPAGKKAKGNGTGTPSEGTGNAMTGGGTAYSSGTTY